jgi:hypothetical protein
MSDGSFDGLVYEDVLPLAWAVRDALPDGPELSGINAENVEVLVADASLDEQRPLGEKKHDEDHALAEDVQRLESKVNVLIQLVARLLTRDAGVPSPRSLRLHAGGIEWLADGTEPTQGLGAVTVYVSRHFPQPLVLTGAFQGVREDAHGRWARLGFAGLAPPVVELLARLIFRHHRRAIAGTRGQPRA